MSTSSGDKSKDLNLAVRLEQLIKGSDDVFYIGQSPETVSTLAGFTLLYLDCFLGTISEGDREIFNIGSFAFNGDRIDLSLFI